METLVQNTRIYSFSWSGTNAKLFYLFFFFLIFFRATPEGYVNSQARGPIRAAAAGLYHSHSNTRSELCLRPTLQLKATLDP